MDLWVTLGVLIKRWYVTLPLLAVVGLAAVQIGNSIEPTYTVTATGRVYCPDRALDPVTGEEVATNPFCGDRTTADLAVAARVFLDSSVTRRDVRDQGLVSDYVVDDNNAPLLDVTVESENEDDAIATLELTMAIFESYVDDQQPDDVFNFTARALNVPAQADSVSSSKTRTQIIVVVAGIIMTTILVHVFDAGLGAYRRRQQEAAAADDEIDDDEPADDEIDEPSLDTAPEIDDTSEPDDEDWEEAKKLFDDEVEKLTSESSRWGR